MDSDKNIILECSYCRFGKSGVCEDCSSTLDATFDLTMSIPREAHAYVVFRELGRGQIHILVLDVRLSSLLHPHRA